MNNKETTTTSSYSELVTLLQSNTKDVMMSIAEKHDIKVYKSHTKPKIAESMKEKLLGNIPYLFSFMDSNSQATLEKVIQFKENETIFDVLDAKPLASLAEYGYLYVEEENGEFHPFLADEVTEAIQNLANNEEYNEAFNKNQEFSKYLTALIHLYGMYSVEQFTSVWNQHHIEPITAEDASDIINRLADWDIQFVYKDHLISSVLFDAEGIDQEALKRILHVAYYMPTQEDIQYYEDHWVNSDLLEYLNMKKYIMAKDLDEVQKNIVLYSIVQGAVIGKSGEKLYQDITKQGFAFGNKEEVTEFIELFKELRANSRTWHNHGFTVQELATSTAVPSSNIKPIKQQPVTVHKVGRNDPCPCGSGKKYKKCHGK